MSAYAKDLIYGYHIDFIGLQGTIKKKYPESFLEKLTLGKILCGKGYLLEEDLGACYVVLRRKTLRC